MDIQLDANVENQDRAKCRKNEAGGMKSFVCRVRDEAEIARMMAAAPKYGVEHVNEA
jgi:hypothetical protein